MKFVYLNSWGSLTFTIWSAKQKKTFGDECFFQKKTSKTNLDGWWFQGHKLLFPLAWLVKTSAPVPVKSMGDGMVRSNRPCHHVWRSVGWSNTRRVVRFWLEPFPGGDGAGMSTVKGVAGGLTSLNFWGGELYIYIFGRKYRFYIPTRQFFYVSSEKGMVFKRKFIFQTIHFLEDMLVSGRVNFVFMLRNGWVMEVWEFSVVVDFHFIDGRKVSYSWLCFGFFCKRNMTSAHVSNLPPSPEVRWWRRDLGPWEYDDHYIFEFKQFAPEKRIVGTRFPICLLYIFGNNPPQMVPMDLNIGNSRVWRLDSGPNLQPCWKMKSFLLWFGHCSLQFFPGVWLQKSLLANPTVTHHLDLVFFGDFVSFHRDKPPWKPTIWEKEDFGNFFQDPSFPTSRLCWNAHFSAFTRDGTVGSTHLHLEGNFLEKTGWFLGEIQVSQEQRKEKAFNVHGLMPTCSQAFTSTWDILTKNILWVCTIRSFFFCVVIFRLKTLAHCTDRTSFLSGKRCKTKKTHCLFKKCYCCFQKSCTSW